MSSYAFNDIHSTKTVSVGRNRVVTYGQQKYVVTYSTHQSTIVNTLCQKAHAILTISSLNVI